LFFTKTKDIDETSDFATNKLRVLRLIRYKFDYTSQAVSYLMK